MNKSDMTLVTALFDLGRGSLDESFARSFDHYKECFSRLLKLEFNLVIYCEPELNDFVWQYRKEHNTRIVNKTLDDLRTFPFYNQIQKIRNNPHWYNQAGWLKESTQAKLELYNPLVMSKMFFLHDASCYDYFHSDQLFWIDGGLSNTVNLEQYFDHNFEKRIKKHGNKMLYLCFPYDGEVEVHGFEKNKLNQLADTNTKFVARGGFFGGSKYSIKEINDIYYKLLDDTLNTGFMGTEESIFTIIAHKHRSKCNIRMIDGNGLVYKFFEDLMKESVSSAEPIAIYVLTYNLPEQFKLFINAFKTAFPREFGKYKKYIINNSDDEMVKETYDKLFKEHNFTVIHEDSNIGINDGRHLAATHFDKSEHDYYVFFEDDFMLCDESYKDKPCKNGLIRWVPNLFDKTIAILENEKLDWVKISFSEFFGDSHLNWSYFNVPQHKKDEYFPIRENGIDRAKLKIDYTGAYNGLSYAVSECHYSNWPLLFSKKGNQKVFLDIVYEHKYEQTLMSQNMNFQREGKVKSAVLLASPIEHDRKFFYEAHKRKENRHYK